MAKAKKKKKLTAQQEFEIMKLVLDKLLWIGFIIMTFGVYKMAETGIVLQGLWYIISGAILLIIFIVLMVKEYEVVK